LRAITHLDKAEAAQSSTKLITNQIHFANRSILSKSLSQIVFTGTKGEVSHVDVQERVRPFGNVTCIGAVIQQPNPGGSGTRSRFSVGGSGVELGPYKCTPLLHSVSLRRWSERSSLPGLDSPFLDLE